MQHKTEEERSHSSEQHCSKSLHVFYIHGRVLKSDVKESYCALKTEETDLNTGNLQIKKVRDIKRVVVSCLSINDYNVLPASQTTGSDAFTRLFVKENMKKSP